MEPSDPLATLGIEHELLLKKHAALQEQKETLNELYREARKKNMELESMEDSDLICKVWVTAFAGKASSNDSLDAGEIGEGHWISQDDGYV